MATYLKVNQPIVAEFEDKDGNWIPFDGSSEAVLKEAKMFYHPLYYEYLGSGYITKVNGKLWQWPKLHHFFKRKK